MRKQFVILIAIFLLVAFAIVLVACNNAELNLSDEVVRIHIRANSNSEIDQSVKLKVRDEVTAFLTDRLEDCTSKTDALKTLEMLTGELEKIADKTLNDNGFTYKSTVCVKNDYFPDKTYGEYFFPAGYYDALMIYLGEGVGDNWWCVAFPPLCFVPSGDDVVYKSWVKEKLDDIFGKK